MLASAAVIVNVVAMPFMLVGLVPLLLIFYWLRNYYLKTAGEIKRLEATGKSFFLRFLITRTFVYSNSLVSPDDRSKDPSVNIDAFWKLYVFKLRKEKFRLQHAFSKVCVFALSTQACFQNCKLVRAMMIWSGCREFISRRGQEFPLQRLPHVSTLTCILEKHSITLHSVLRGSHALKTLTRFVFDYLVSSHSSDIPLNNNPSRLVLNSLA